MKIICNMDHHHLHHNLKILFYKINKKNEILIIFNRVLSFSGTVAPFGLSKAIANTKGINYMYEKGNSKGVNYGFEKGNKNECTTQPDLESSTTNVTSTRVSDIPLLKKLIKYEYFKLPNNMSIVIQPDKQDEDSTDELDNITLVLCLDISFSMRGSIEKYVIALYNKFISMGFTNESEIILVTFGSETTCYRCPLNSILTIRADGSTFFSSVFPSIAQILRQDEHIVVIVVSDGEIADKQQIPSAAATYHKTIKNKKIQFNFVGIISWGLNGATICEQLCPHDITPWRRTETTVGEYLNQLPNFFTLKIIELPIKFITPGEEMTALWFNALECAITFDQLESVVENINYRVTFNQKKLCIYWLEKIVKKWLITYQENLVMLQQKRDNSSVQKAINIYLKMFENVQLASRDLAEDTHTDLAEHTHTYKNSKNKSGRLKKFFQQITSTDTITVFKLLDEVITEAIDFLKREEGITQQLSRKIKKTDTELNRDIEEMSRRQAIAADKLGRRAKAKMGPIVEGITNELKTLNDIEKKWIDISDEPTSIISLMTFRQLIKEYLDEIDFNKLLQLNEDQIHEIARYFPLVGWDCYMEPKNMGDTTQVYMIHITSDTVMLSTEDKYSQAGRDARLPSENTGTHQIIPVFIPQVFEQLVKFCPRLLQQSFLLLLFGTNKVEVTIHPSDPLVGVYGAAAYYFAYELCKCNSTILYEKLKIVVELLCISGMRRYLNAYLHLKTNVSSELQIKSWTFSIDTAIIHLINDHIGIPQFIMHLKLVIDSSRDWKNHFFNISSCKLIKVLQMLCTISIMKKWIQTEMRGSPPQYTKSFFELLGYESSMFVYPPQLFKRPELIKPPTICLEKIDTKKIDSILGSQRDKINMIIQLPEIIKYLYENNQSLQEIEDYNEIIPVILYSLGQGIKNFPQMENNINPADMNYVRQYLDSLIKETYENDKRKWEAERNKEEMNVLLRKIVPMMIKVDDVEFFKIAETGLKCLTDTGEVVVCKLPNGGPYHTAVIALMNAQLFHRALALLTGEIIINGKKKLFSMPIRITKNQKNEFIMILENIESSGINDESLTVLIAFIKAIKTGFEYRDTSKSNRHNHSNIVPSYNSFGFNSMIEYAKSLVDAGQINELINYIERHEICNCKCNNWFKSHIPKKEDLSIFLNRMSNDINWWKTIVQPITKTINIEEYKFAKFHYWLCQKNFTQSEYNLVLNQWLEKNNLTAKRMQLLKKFPQTTKNIRKRHFISV